MSESQLLDPIQILYDPDTSLSKDAVLLSHGKIKAFGKQARDLGKRLGIPAKSASNKLLAPCLVDPHSILEEPLNGRSETLASLRRKAAQAGYGQLALLPRSSSWRDSPERLQGFKDSTSEVLIHLWGGFTKGGKGQELSPHADLVQHGAIGLAEDDSTLSSELLKRGLVISEMGQFPLLLAPRDVKVQGNGMVREGVEALRAGWWPDPVASETLPLSELLELHRQHPQISLRLMNLSTADGVSLLAKSQTKPMASVCWWHLIADTSTLKPSDIGLRVLPSIGGSQDRLALIKGLSDGTLTAIAVHATPLDEEETKLPFDQRAPGLSGHHLVLPSLWQELIVNSGWSVEKLWEVLSFGPSKMLGLSNEHLSLESSRWLLFDPEEVWTNTFNNQLLPFAANQPWQGEKIIGKIVDCGLKYQGYQPG